MKISPVAQSSGQPGESLTSTNVGRTADPMKMDRARAIARGEKLPELAPEPERIRPDARKLKMRTNFSTNRDDNGQFVEEVAPAATTEATAAVQSSEEDVSEPGAVEATQPLSPQFAALAKQKRALQLERAELDKQKAEFSQKASTMPADELIAKLKSSPLSVLQEHGVTYDQLTEAILSGQGQNNPEIQALREEIKSLKEGVDKSFSTREEQAEEAALTEMLYEAEGLAKDGDAFEMIRERDAYDQVLRLIHSTYKQTGRVLDVTEAMTRVESKLMAEAEKLASINKVRNKLSAPAPAALKPQPQPQGMRTLTARDTASPLMDRRARAIAAAMGTLKR